MTTWVTGTEWERTTLLIHTEDAEGRTDTFQLLSTLLMPRVGDALVFGSTWGYVEAGDWRWPFLRVSSRCLVRSFDIEQAEEDIEWARREIEKRGERGEDLW